MSRKSDEKAVVDALVDEELDLRDLVERVKEVGSDAGDQIMAAVDKLIGKEVHGSISKQLLRQAFELIFVAHFIRLVHRAQKIADSNLAQQVAAIRKFGRPITEIAAVSDEDVKQRIMEKAVG